MIGYRPTPGALAMDRDDGRPALDRGVGDPPASNELSRGRIDLAGLMERGPFIRATQRRRSQPRAIAGRH